MLTEALIRYFSAKTAELAQSEVDKGGLPFSSIIVDEFGMQIGEGVNQVCDLNDCTAHAEIQAIRSASTHLNSASLKGATLFASGEPCGLCYTAISLAKVSHVVILLDRHEVKRLGFDYLWTYQPSSDSAVTISEELLSRNDREMPFKGGARQLDSIGL